jgi:hypothetical protein
MCCGRAAHSAPPACKSKGITRKEPPRNEAGRPAPPSTLRRRRCVRRSRPGTAEFTDRCPPMRTGCDVDPPQTVFQAPSFSELWWVARTENRMQVFRRRSALTCCAARPSGAGGAGVRADARPCPYAAPCDRCGSRDQSDHLGACSAASSGHALRPLGTTMTAIARRACRSVWQARRSCISRRPSPAASARRSPLPVRAVAPCAATRPFISRHALHLSPERAAIPAS